jgi:hypothetical protein
MAQASIACANSLASLSRKAPDFAHALARGNCVAIACTLIGETTADDLRPTLALEPFVSFDDTGRRTAQG